MDTNLTMSFPNCETTLSSCPGFLKSRQGQTSKSSGRWPVNTCQTEKQTGHLPELTITTIVDF